MRRAASGWRWLRCEVCAARGCYSDAGRGIRDLGSPWRTRGLVASLRRGLLSPPPTISLWLLCTRVRFPIKRPCRRYSSLFVPDELVRTRAARLRPGWSHCPSLRPPAMLHRLLLAALVVLHYNKHVAAQVTPPASLATQFALTTSTSMPFPTATLANPDTQTFITAGWSLSKGKIQNGASDLAFVADPFPNAPAPSSSGPTTGPVLEVTYPAGSFSHDTGGAQLFSLWNTSDGSQFHSVLLSYEVAFDTNFDFVMGGKLPGVRGGPDPNGCSGGSAANGSNCFSSRVMWRKKGQGEGVCARALRDLR